MAAVVAAEVAAEVVAVDAPVGVLEKDADQRSPMEHTR